jgi:hypothetical protein
MKKLLALAGSMFLLTGCFTKPHAQLSSRIDQLSAESKQVIHLELDGVVHGMTIEKGEFGAEIHADTPGTYLVTYSPQIALVDEKKRGCFITWLSINGKDVEDSGVKHCFAPSEETTAVLVGQWAGNLESGDDLQVMFSGFNTKTKFYARDGGRRQVNIPSVLFTVVQL